MRRNVENEYRQLFQGILLEREANVKTNKVASGRGRRVERRILVFVFKMGKILLCVCILTEKN